MVSILFFYRRRTLIHELSDLSKIYNISDKFTFLGYKKNARQFIPLLDLLICPSRSEGLPLSIMEAFAEKALVLASDIPEHKEVIENKKNGFLFRDNDTSDLIDKIEEIASLTHKVNIIKSARISYKKNFQFFLNFGTHFTIHCEENTTTKEVIENKKNGLQKFFQSQSLKFINFSLFFKFFAFCPMFNFII